MLALLFSQAQRHVLMGYYPCTEEYAISLAGISMQVWQTEGLVGLGYQPQRDKAWK